MGRFGSQGVANIGERSKLGGIEGVELQGKSSMMFKNDLMSPKQIAAMKMKKKKKSQAKKEQLTDTLNVQENTLQRVVASEKPKNVTVLEKRGNSITVNRRTFKDIAES